MTIFESLFGGLFFHDRGRAATPAPFLYTGTDKYFITGASVKYKRVANAPAGSVISESGVLMFY